MQRRCFVSAVVIMIIKNHKNNIKTSFLLAGDKAGVSSGGGRLCCFVAWLFGYGIRGYDADCCSAAPGSHFGLANA